MDINTLHPILLPNKGHSLFSVLGDQKEVSASKYLYLYLSTCLVDRVPNDPGHFLYKMVMARLRLVGFKYAEIRQVCPYCENTIRNWSRILERGDAQEVAKAFGLDSRGKLTPDSLTYVENRYLELKALKRHDFRKTICNELVDYFSIKISGERLRQIFREFDTKKPLPSIQGIDGDVLVGNEFADNRDVFAEKSLISGAPETRDNNHPGTCENTQKSGTVSSLEKAKSRNPIDDFPGVNLTDGYMSNALPVMPISGAKIPASEKMFHHMGLVFFLPYLSHLQEILGTAAPVCVQVISQLLLGAVNIEQGKLLSAKALEFMIGKVMIYRQGLRKQLDDIASSEFVIMLARANLLLLDLTISKSMVFYYDPHGKLYTGELPILKGWCAKLKGSAKVLYSDYIHSEEGWPLFMKHYDNFYDLRERIFFTLHEFSKIFPGFVPQMTFVIDRGIYGLTAMRLFIESGYHLITWEKDYSKDGWNEQSQSFSFLWEKFRNNCSDSQKYSFEYQEGIWARDSRFRRIIVRATNPSGKTVEVSILCSNQDLAAEKVITLIFNRWIQENDFGYLIVHFGIDQLDSRAADAYEKVEELEDRMVASRAFKQKQKERAKLRNSLKNSLLKKEDSLARLTNSQKNKQLKILAELQKESTRLANVDKQTKKALDFMKAVDRLKKSVDRCEKFSEKFKAQRKKREDEWDAKIQFYKQDIESLEKEISQTVSEESRRQVLIEESYMFLDTSRKAVIDMCRIIARNSFYSRAKDFRRIYNNYRDDHDIFRTMTEAPGSISMEGGNVIIRLWPPAEYAIAEKERIDAFLILMSTKLTQWMKNQTTLDLSVSLVLKS